MHLLIAFFPLEFPSKNLPPKFRFFPTPFETTLESSPNFYSQNALSKSISKFHFETTFHRSIQALTANLDNDLTHFQPMIAMLCGQHGKFHNQYLNEQKQWVTDDDPAATCIKDKLEILEYCRKVSVKEICCFEFERFCDELHLEKVKQIQLTEPSSPQVYPKKDIRNIVESNHYYKIDSWKPVKSRHHLTSNEKQHFVKPIRCLEGNFQSDALLVPEHCVFDHLHNASVCEANAYWNKTANQSCKDKGKMLQSYAVLLPCGIVSMLFLKTLSNMATLLIFLSYVRSSRMIDCLIIAAC